MNSQDIIYYNMLINNVDGVNILQANSTDVRTQAILNNPNDYHCAMVRANIPLDEVGLFTFQDNGEAPYTGTNYTFAEESDTYRSNYIITMTYGISGAGDYKESYFYVPWIQDQPNDSSNRLVFHLQNFVEMINRCMFSVYSGLFAANTPPRSTGSAIPTLSGEFAPYMIFDPSEQKFSLIAPKNRFSTDEAAATRINLFFNSELYYFFDYFADLFYGYSSIPNTFQFKIYNQFNNSYAGTRSIITTVPTLLNCYIMRQEESNLYAFREWDTLVFSSNNLPINYEYTQVSGGSSNNVSFPIIADFVIGSEIITRTTVTVIPNPTRWVKMNGSGGITSINMTIFVRNKDGTYKLLPIPPHRSVSIKLAFKLNAAVTV